MDFKRFIDDNLDMELSLKLSRKNCHIYGLDSIVIKQNSDNSLIRIYKANKDHHLTEGALGVHNHRYPLKLTGLYGNAVNVSYEKVHNVLPTPYKRFLFWHKNAIKEVVPTYIEKTTSDLLTYGKEIYLNRKDLHTIYVEEGQNASWLVEEGKQEVDFVELFSKNDYPVCYEHSLFQTRYEIAQALTEIITSLENLSNQATISQITPTRIKP